MPLTRFLSDGRLEIDNNAAATFFTLIESARRNGVNPFVYLRDVLRRLPSHPISRIDDLLPDRWKSPKTT